MEPLQIALGISVPPKVRQDETTGAFPHGAGVVHRIVNINCR
jgi:hypothetical protein